jgi:hypothetical protein
MVYELDCSGSTPSRVLILFSTPKRPGLLWVYNASYSVGNGGSFTEIKLPGRKAEQSLQSGAEIKNVVVTPPVLHMSSLATGTTSPFYLYYL